MTEIPAVPRSEQVDTTQLELHYRAAYRDQIFTAFETRWKAEYLQERALQFKKLQQVKDIRIGEVQRRRR